jgi:hypothetical protein
MTYYESAENITITRERALRECDNHGVIDYDEFFAECGNRAEYDAQSVLRFLGY